MTVLGVIWYLLAALLLAIFAVMDGFDLGIGILYGVTKDPDRRSRMLGVISPIWNGNEVWLIAGIGSILAAFPPVYSAMLSSLYIPVILVLMALIFRACGVELRSKVDDGPLARLLDFSIPVGSLIPAWGFGLVAGNILLGFPIDDHGNLQGTFLFFLRPYALLASLVSATLFVLHGAIFMILKSEAEDRQIFERTARKALGVFAFLVVVNAAAAPIFLGPRFEAAALIPAFIVFTAICVLAYFVVFLALRRALFGQAFVASVVGIATLAASAAALLFPVLLPSSVSSANDLTIANAAATDKSLFVMLIIALVTVPVIVIYVFVAYRSFRGKAVPIRY